MPLQFNGKLSGLLETMDAAGIDMGLRARRRDQGLGRGPHQRVHRHRPARPAGPVRHRAPRALRRGEPRHLRDNGIVGVKLHPLFQDVSLGDPRVHEILAALAEEGMPVVCHVGAGGDEAANERGRPHLLRTIADTIPDLKLIACHYGGYHLLDEAEEHVVGSSVTLETSWPPTMAELEPGDASSA